MGSSSDSTHSSHSGGDGDSPPTSPPAAPVGHANTNRSLSFSSKIPKLSTGASKVFSHSRPQTPADSSTTSMALDWGSSGEWTRVASGVKDPSPKTYPEVVEDGALSADQSSDEHLDEVSIVANLGLDEPTMLCSSTISNDGTFPDSVRKSNSEQLEALCDGGSPVLPSPSRAFPHALIPETTSTAAKLETPSSHTSSTTSNNSDQSEDESENLSRLPPASGNVDQDASGDVNNSAAVFPIKTSSGAGATKSTNSDRPEEVSEEELLISPIPTHIDQHDITQEDNHTVTKMATPSSDTIFTDTTSSTSPIEVSEEEAPILPAFNHSTQHAIPSQGHQASITVDAQPSDATTSDTSESDVPAANIPPTVIRGPFLNISTKEQAVDTGPSPRVILRGLIRDAYLEMMHLTLQHSNCSRNDMVHGLDYAYALWQVAVSKLDLLTMFHENATDMDVKDLRRWIANVDHFNTYTRRQPRVLAVFELLSVEEMRSALAELVQSRLGVENDVKQTRSMLMEHVEAVEQDVGHAAEPIESAAGYGRGAKDSIDPPEAFFSGDTAWDAVLASIMLALIGALYVCVQD